MRNTTKILKTVKEAIDLSLADSSITGITVGYSLVNTGGTTVSVDMVSMSPSGSQSQDMLKYDCRVSVSAVFRLNGPGYSVLAHTPLIDAIYNTFQSTSTAGFIWTSASANNLVLESVNDAGSVKDGPIADTDGSYVVRYVEDFNMVFSYNELESLQATQELPFQLNRVLGTDDRAYFYDPVLDQHDIELDPTDYVNDNNNLRLIGDFQQMTNWSFQIKLDQFELADENDFFECCDYHDVGAGSVDDSAGRTYGYRPPMSVNVIEENGSYYWAVGVRPDGSNKDHFCKYPLTLGEWVTVKLRVDKFDYFPNGQITAQIGSTKETLSGISTKVAPAYGYFLLFGFYMRDGYTSAERQNVIGSYRNIRVGDEKSNYKVVPGFNRIEQYN
jgi:hypothetical protein